ncbi:MAG: CBS domain-containing protein [Kofleriaceae bacterium]|nr:CBS domain-containing protein [Kofleriaceae bacterium]
MSRDLVCIEQDSSVDEANKLMTEMKIRRLLVTDENMRLLGIVSKHDVLYATNISRDRALKSRRHLQGTTKVRTVMTKNPYTINSQDSIAKAAQLMRKRKFGALPVVKKGLLVGIITESDILDAFASMMSFEAPSVLFTLQLDKSDSNWFDKLIALAKDDDCTLISVTRLMHKAQRIAIVRIEGAKSEAFVEGLWNAGLSVLSIQAEP